MTTTLITGANKGLGYETARQLIAKGHTVYIGARSTGRGRAAADELGARFVRIDVTDSASVREAADLVLREAGHIDVLVNNAAIDPFVMTRDVTVADMRTTFDTNVFGVVRVTQAFLPLLEASEAPVIVNVSSSMGSVAYVSDPTRLESTVPLLPYTASKAALNMVNAQYANAYPRIRVNAVDPGFTKTDLNDNRGTQSVEEGAEIIVRMATIGADGPTGQYVNMKGTVPW
jgi:NAD(P)-dependent dehydrogenase (short-subunit alcohol dehydrogenase family)